LSGRLAASLPSGRAYLLELLLAETLPFSESVSLPGFTYILALNKTFLGPETIFYCPSLIFIKVKP
jgi:hypothetical protein